MKMTVRELRAALEQYPDDAEIGALYDSRLGYGELVGVEPGEEGVNLVIDS